MKLKPVCRRRRNRAAQRGRKCPVKVLLTSSEGFMGSVLAPPVPTTSPVLLSSLGPTAGSVAMPGLAQALSQLAPATLRDLDAVALLNRVDTKYLLTLPRLLALLPSLAREYRVLDIEGRRLH